MWKLRRKAAPPPKTFLLGVGAQKGGTTWLHQYLQKHWQCNFGPVKEYAAFTAAFLPERFIDRQISRVDALQAELSKLKQAQQKGNTFDPDLLYKLMDKVALPLDLERYVAHFDTRYAARTEVQVVGDITPSYSALRAPEFRRIRDLLEAGGYQVKVVFLMRDPVERCYSSVRMSLRDRTSWVSPDHPEELDALVKRFARQPWCLVRTRYEETVEALEAVFDQKDLFYGFYETFFCEEEVRRLTDFLGIAPWKPELWYRANSSPQRGKLAPETVLDLRELYHPTYAFCRDQFGADFINEIWGQDSV